MTEKHSLRQKTLRLLRRQPEKTRQSKSLKITKRLCRSKWYRKAKSLFCYVAIDGEVLTRPLLEKGLADGKNLFVPVVVDKRRRRMTVAQVKDLKKDLKHKGHYGIPHPLRLSTRRISLNRLDLVIVPGVAFDRKGGRLGRGLGYFDRFLEKIPVRIPRVGLAFKFQVVKQLPRQSHDQPMTRIITE